MVLVDKVLAFFVSFVFYNKQLLHTPFIPKNFNAFTSESKRKWATVGESALDHTLLSKYNDVLISSYGKHYLLMAGI